jgi:hypothetical protein
VPFVVWFSNSLHSLVMSIQNFQQEFEQDYTSLRISRIKTKSCLNQNFQNERIFRIKPNPTQTGFDFDFDFILQILRILEILIQTKETMDTLKTEYNEFEQNYTD